VSPEQRASLARLLAGAARPVKFTLLVAGDLVVLALSMLLAIGLRYDGGLELGIADHRSVLLLAPVIGVAMFRVAGVYRIVVRYAGPLMAPRIAVASGIAAVVVAGIGFILDREGGQSRAVFVNFGIFGFLGTWLLRLLAGRLLRSTSTESEAVRVVVYGAGVAGAGLATALGPDPVWKAVAFVDDNPRLHGRKVMDLPVLPSSELARLVSEERIQAVFLALPSVTPDVRREILARLRPLGVRVLTVPTLEELVAGRAGFRDLRQLDVEDLIGRRTVTADEHLLHRSIGDRVVLVTGGGGSIGSELCRQILATGPRRLVILDQSEFNLYRIGLELERTHPDRAGEVRTVLGDVCDDSLLDEIFAREGVEIVFHAAAYKHVPIVEANEPEGVRTNVLGTAAVADAAIRHGIERFVLVSTDKAVRPTNVMGASKRVAELAVQARASIDPARARSHPIFCMVRFGNVIESSGSVVPRFRAQVESGGPVTVTHPEITRYFMTIPEAAELVLQSAAMARGGEVFLLDMGKPVRILDLARSMIELSGLSVRDADHPDGDIEIRITGLRPGEKIHEELLIGHDSEPSDHPRIHRAREARLDPEATADLVRRIRQAVDHRDRRELRDLLTTHAGLHQEIEPVRSTTIEATVTESD
jgi:FlaA1/EpsC-like NDP-sugar epimerase